MELYVEKQNACQRLKNLVGVKLRLMVKKKQQSKFQYLGIHITDYGDIEEKV